MDKAEWSSGLEHLLKAEGEKCLSYFWLHGAAESYFGVCNTGLALPVIVLSTLSGAMSIGGLGIPATAVGFVSIGVGILQTINNFFGFSARAEGHRVAKISYGKLHRFLSVELSLPREQRMMAADLLKYVREQMERLLEIAPAIPANSLARYKKQFVGTEVSHPVETNGLDAIEVNSPATPTNKIKIEFK